MYYIKNEIDLIDIRQVSSSIFNRWTELCQYLENYFELIGIVTVNIILGYLQ